MALRYSLFPRDFQSGIRSWSIKTRPVEIFFVTKKKLNFFLKLKNHLHVQNSPYVLNPLCRNPPSHCTVTREWNITQLLLCILLFFMCFHSFSSSFLWFPALVEHWQCLPIIPASLVCCQPDFKPSAYSSCSSAPSVHTELKSSSVLLKHSPSFCWFSPPGKFLPKSLQWIFTFQLSWGRRGSRSCSWSRLHQRRCSYSFRVGQAGQGIPGWSLRRRCFQHFLGRKKGGWGGPGLPR